MQVRAFPRHCETLQRFVYSSIRGPQWDQNGPHDQLATLKPHLESCHKVYNVKYFDLYDVRWLIFSLFYSYIVIVPLCYTRIYKLRKAMKKMGNDFEKRQKRNVVTFKYNMFIWAAELTSVSWLTLWFECQQDYAKFTMPGEYPLLVSQLHIYLQCLNGHLA